MNATIILPPGREAAQIAHKRELLRSESEIEALIAQRQSALNQKQWDLACSFQRLLQAARQPQTADSS